MMKLVSAFSAAAEHVFAALRRRLSVARLVVPQPQLIGVNASFDTALTFDVGLNALSAIGPVPEPSLVAFASDGSTLFAIASTSLLHRRLSGSAFKSLALAPQSEFLKNSLVCYTGPDGGQFLLMLTTAGSLLRFDTHGTAAGQNQAEPDDPTFLILATAGQQSMALLPSGSGKSGLLLILNPLNRNLIAYDLDTVSELSGKPDFGPFDLTLATRPNLSPVSLAVGPDTNLYILMLDTTDAHTLGTLTFWALGNTILALATGNPAGFKMQPVQVQGMATFHGIISFAVGGIGQSPIIYAAMGSGLQQITVSPTSGDGVAQAFPATTSLKPGLFSAGALAYLTIYP